MMEEMDRVMLRAMAWERAKGELRSILHLYYGEEEGHKEYSEVIEAFIKHVEDHAIGQFT